MGKYEPLAQFLMARNADSWPAASIRSERNSVSPSREAPGPQPLPLGGVPIRTRDRRLAVGGGRLGLAYAPT